MEGQNNGMPAINGQMYGWADIKCFVNGTLVKGITAIKYEDKQTIDKVYGAGRYPIGYGKGRIECSGSITLLKEELVALQSVAPNGRLQDLPSFDIVISYLPENGVITTDILKTCKFSENKRDVKEGDTSISTEMELMVMSIKWGKPNQ
jgi:hypothetical protein